MKILLLTEYLLPQDNGIAIRCENMIAGFRRRGHSVTVFGPHGCPSADRTLLSYPSMFNPNSRMMIDPWHELETHMLQYRYDVVHICYPAFYANPVLILAKQLQVPVICSNHVDLTQYNHFYVNEPYRTILHYYVTNIMYAPQLLYGTTIMAPS